MIRKQIRGRGASINPPNPFEPLHFEPDPEEEARWLEEERVGPGTILWVEHPRTIVHRVSSPDLGIVYALNPYQGCEHGCIYCYARPYHTYWGWSAGLDFERHIVVKPRAPELLHEFLARQYPHRIPIHMGTATDIYQPVERYLRITRRLLEVFLRWKNPVRLITKNRLILRDLDLLQELNRVTSVRVMITITTLNEEVRRKLEPRAVSGRLRLQTIEALAKAGIPTGVMVAPIIPGLTEHEVPRILEEAARHGASFAGYTLLRLPPQVEPVFQDWLERAFPERKKRILDGIRQCHAGKLSDTRWFERLRGSGPRAKTIARLFEIFHRKYFPTARKDTPSSGEELTRMSPGVSAVSSSSSDSRHLFPLPDSTPPQ